MEILNKKTQLLLSEDKCITYADLIGMQLNKPLQAGITLKEMKRDLEVLKKLDEAEEVITLTDEEFKYVANVVEHSQWAVRHLDIIEFADYIANLK